MTGLGMDHVRTVMGPYHDKIYQVVAQAWEEWRTIHSMRIDADMPPLLYRRTISNYVFDAIARRAIPVFGSEPRVRVKIEAQTFKLAFKGIVARFKKGGEDGLGSNVPTQAALAFIHADGVLPGMPAETAKIEIIWRPNEIWTQLAGVFVVARDGDSLIWEYEIEAGEIPGAELIPFPSPAPELPEPDGSDLVKPKSKPTTKPETK